MRHKQTVRSSSTSGKQLQKTWANCHGSTQQWARLNRDASAVTFAGVRMKGRLSHVSCVVTHPFIVVASEVAIVEHEHTEVRHRRPHLVEFRWFASFRVEVAQVQLFQGGAVLQQVLQLALEVMFNVVHGEHLKTGWEGNILQGSPGCLIRSLQVADLLWSILWNGMQSCQLLLEDGY